jgi:transcriptional antiterminator RfaH
VAVITGEINEGDTVKIAEGAFCGLEGVVSQILSGKDRVRLLTNFLGRNIAVEMRRPGILPVQRHPLAT